MKSADWVELLNKIPPDDHEQLVVALNNGLEIAIQRIMRIESEFLLVRGRMGGTSDLPRLLCLPYDRLTFLAYARPVAESHMIEIFGSPLRAVHVSTALEAQPESAPEGTAGAEPIEAEDEKPTGSKSSLLEKLRARVAAQTIDPHKPK